jgi:hypothetical protein
MSTLADSYVSRVLFASPTPARGLDAVRSEVALAEVFNVRPVPARASLYARPRPEMAREAHGRRPAVEPTLVL